MATRQYDNPLRYLVESLTRAEVEHLVELDAFNANGKCTCEHFRFKLEPQLDQGAEPSDATRCHHICSARDLFTDTVIRTIIENMPGGGKGGEGI